MLRLSLTILCLLLLPSCGYRFAGSGARSGVGRSVAIPTFINQTTSYRVEQRLAEAVRKEFVRRTRFELAPGPDGDVVVSGEILGFSAIPIIFNSQGRGSAYTIAVDLKLKVTDQRDGAILFNNDRWTFREVFELSQSSGTFVPEDAAAMERLSSRFASALVAAVVNGIR